MFTRVVTLVLPIAIAWPLAGCRGLPKATSAVPPTVAAEAAAARPALVLTTDFGLRDGAVSAMKGVIDGVDGALRVSDLTHEIPPFDVWQAAMRLQQTYKYWPRGTVFVTVVDPGVGSARRSIAVRTKTGHVFVGPDNGHLSLVTDEAGVDGVRVIDEATRRRPGSENCNTFHGRDVYAFVAAQLAAGRLRFEDLSEAASPPVRLKYQPAEVKGGVLHGTVVVLDGNFGNVWTNIPKAMLAATFPNARELRAYVAHRGQKVFDGRLPVAATFAGVPKGQPLIFVNSLLNLGLATNQGDFAAAHQIQAGPEWTIVFSKP